MPSSRPFAASSERHGDPGSGCPTPLSQRGTLIFAEKCCGQQSLLTVLIPTRETLLCSLQRQDHASCLLGHIGLGSQSPARQGFIMNLDLLPLEPLTAPGLLCVVPGRKLKNSPSEGRF